MKFQNSPNLSPSILKKKFVSFPIRMKIGLVVVAVLCVSEKASSVLSFKNICARIILTGYISLSDEG